MPFPEDSSSISVTFDSPSRAETDWLAVPLFEGDGVEAWPWMAGSTRTEVARALRVREASAKPFGIFLSPVTDGGMRASRVVLVGAGSRDSYGTDRARRLATSAALAARERGASRVALIMAGVPAHADEAQAMAEGLTLSKFQPAAYKTDVESRKANPALTVVAGADVTPPVRSEIERAVARGHVLGNCSNLARDLANEPANRMTPAAFAESARRLSSETDLSLEILDEGRIAELGMGLLLAVGQGSSERPRVVVLRYEPAHAASDSVLGMVGKGVTFDSGGISIKPSDGMFRMKTDMTGGAAVVAAMLGVAALKPAIRVIGVVPLAENMPGGRAMRPGDVVRGAEGTTVEIIDTDAEGRLLLADGLWYARRLGATHLIDVATLTGAVQVALGRTTSGLLGGPDWWLDLVRKTADREGDRAWILPTFDDYKDLLRSEIADLANVGGRVAGAISAALFLKEFSGGLPWAHLDIAGTSWADEAQPYQPKGPTGVAVRTLVEMAFTSRLWKA